MGHLRRFFTPPSADQRFAVRFFGGCGESEKPYINQGGGLRGLWLQRMLKNRWSLAFRP
jgi:hypothetical protein